MLHLTFTTRQNLKEFADNNFKVAKIVQFCFDKAEKENMMVTSIFSFSNNVFKRLPGSSKVVTVW